MKTSTVLASLLFGSFAVAAPLDKRAMVTKTEVITETVVVYTTVYDDEPAAPAATTANGLFYEQPSVPSSAAAAVTSAAAPAYTPPAQVNTPAPVPVVTPSPVAAPVVPSAPAVPSVAAPVVPSVAPVAPAPSVAAPVVPSVAPAPAPAPVPTPAPAPVTPPSTSSSSSGLVKGGNNVDITIYDNGGTPGACGTKLYDTDMIVALAKPTWGESTYDVMTGDATNPYCGKKVNITYGSKTVTATIMDLCPGCSGQDLDLSHATWNALGLTEITRLKASWTMA